MNESLLELYLAEKNASKEVLDSLKSSGQAMQLVLRNKETSEVVGTQVYIQRPHDFGHPRAHHQVMELFNHHLPLILYGMKLCPSPKTRFFNKLEPMVNSESDRQLRTHQKHANLTNALYALSTATSGKFDVIAVDNHKSWPITEVLIEKFNNTLLKELVTVNQRKITINELSMTTYRHFENPTTDRVESIKTQLSQICRIEPSFFSNWILMPSSYYDNDIGLEVVALNAFRNGSNASNYAQFQSEAKQVLQKVLLHPVLNRAKVFVKNIQALNSYIESNKDILELAIHNEVMAMKSSHRAINISHHYKDWINIAFTDYGWMRSSQFEWSNYADLSFHSDFHNSLFQSILPEIKADSLSKNPTSRVNNATSLISNFNVRELPVVDVYGTRFKTIEQLRELENQLANTPKSRYSPSTLSLHTTSIDEKPFFQGYFEGIPSIDQERYVSHMTKLMQVERGAKLSGAQFKLPVSLSIENGQKHLKRQTGNMPFTHIAKMPQPDCEVLTLSEWLALRLLKDSGLNVAKNQLVAYTNSHESFEGQREGAIEQQFSDISTGDSSSIEEELFKEVGAAFEEINHRLLAQGMRDKMAKVPPFLISERFDIPYSQTDSVNYRITSIDLGAISNTMPKDKYEPTFESVANKIKESIPRQFYESIADNLYEQIIASIITHNNDLHVKNVTILAKEDVRTGEVSYEMSPIYDVLITPMVFSDLDEFSLYSQALSINGTKCPTKEEVIAFGVNSLGLNLDAATDKWTQLEDRMSDAARNLKANLPEEISNNILWSSSINDGLMMVQRNIKHLRTHGKPYGHYIEEHLMERHSNSLSSMY